MPLSHELLYSSQFLLYWFIYSVICFPLVSLIMNILPWRIRRHGESSFLFFYLLSISILFFGLIIALLLAIGLRIQKPPRKKIPYFVSVSYPDFQYAPRKEEKSFGEASGFKVITEDAFSKGKRKEMLVALNQFDTNYVNRVNEIALSDDLDEVRLYAQGLIEKKERKLSIEMKRSYGLLLKENDAKKKAYYKKQIAEILWEQIYQFMVGKETMDATLQQIKKYAEEALNKLQGDMELPMLLTKIALRESDIDMAKKWLKKAHENGVSQYKTYSMHAEIDYNEKKYRSVAQHLQKCRNFGVIGLIPVVLFWTSHD